jgi:hypothetical protein
VTVLRARPRHLEDGEAFALMAWATVTFYQGEPIAMHLTHVPNGGKRNAREAGRLRRMGVKAGYPDYALDIPRQEEGTNRWIHGFRLELKAPQELLGRAPRLTDLQLEQINRLTKQGYRTVVAHGWVMAAALISEYLGLRFHAPCTSRQ